MSTAPAPTVDWSETLQEVPGALGAILQEIFAHEDREESRRFRNSRPKARERTIADVHNSLHASYSDLPFAEALEPLLKPSRRAIAERANMDQSYLSALIAGKRPLDRYKLEALARACRVSPGYFREYRSIVVADAVMKRMVENPSASIAAFRAIRVDS